MDADTSEYYKAYNTCSPAAQSQTMEKCGYATLVEGYYTSCMSQKGFGDADENMDKVRYGLYLESYRQCSVIANSEAQKKCNYGAAYQEIYNQCMTSYGFDSNGDRVSKASEKKKPSEDDSTLPTKNNGSNRRGIGRFFDSIL
jgi:hypothetical protein